MKMVIGSNRINFYPGYSPDTPPEMLKDASKITVWNDGKMAVNVAVLYDASEVSDGIAALIDTLERAAKIACTLGT